MILSLLFVLFSEGAALESRGVRAAPEARTVVVRNFLRVGIRFIF